MTSFSAHLTFGCFAARSSELLYPRPIRTTEVRPICLSPRTSSNHSELNPPIGAASTLSSAAVISMIPSAINT